MDETEFPAARRSGHRNSVRYGPGTADEILRRVAAGESVQAICRDAGMPLASTVSLWVKERPGFAAAMLAARTAAGGPFRGRRALWCEETAQAIYDRVCAGEATTAICREPEMPSMSTLTNWRKQHPEFGAAMEEAYEIRAETWFDRGFEIAQAITPQTA
jgi:transposase-like protein